MPIRIPADADLNTLRTPGFYWCDGATNANRPDDSGSFCLLIEKTGSWAGNGVKQTYTNFDPGIIYTRVSPLKDIWNPWKPLATAVFPQEFDLPLEGGFSKYYCAKYSKTQDGMVTVTLWISGSGAANAETIIATLPEGFRPAELFKDTGIVDNGTISSQNQCGIEVNLVGQIAVQSVTEWSYVSALFTFRAAD